MDSNPATGGTPVPRLPRRRHGSTPVSEKAPTRKAGADSVPPEQFTTAVVVNLVILPGAGYFLIGKPLIALGIMVIVGFNAIVPIMIMAEMKARHTGGIVGFMLVSWLFWQALMLFDVLRRRSNAIKASKVRCIACSELIEETARICPNCRTAQVPVADPPYRGDDEATPIGSAVAKAAPGFGAAFREVGHPGAESTGGQDRVPCPQCAELVMRAAKVCRFCGHVIPHVEMPIGTSGTGGIHDPELSTRSPSPAQKRAVTWRKRGDRIGSRDEKVDPAAVRRMTAIVIAIVAALLLFFGGIPLAVAALNKAEDAERERRSAALTAGTPVSDPVAVVSLQSIPPELCGMWIVTRVLKRNPAITPGSVLFVVTPEWISESTGSPVLRATDIMFAPKGGNGGCPLVSFTAGGPLILVEHRKELPFNQRVVSICRGRPSSGSTVPMDAIVDWVEVSIFQGQR